MHEVNFVASTAVTVFLNKALNATVVYTEEPPVVPEPHCRATLAGGLAAASKFAGFITVIAYA